ncbi:unnamed protein product, partial [Schistocephalus solidus]|uniref:Uncharacterized protein n=1 Tax=Schistocephalus solidus TaxID=70667 RepID=A0A183SSA5_SCHSO
MLLWPSLPGSQLSPSGHTPANRHDQRAKPGEGLRCCVCLHTRYLCSLPPVLALSRPPCPSSSPFPTPLPSPLTSPPPPPLSSSFYSGFYPSSSSSILILPSFPTVEKSYGEGDMQSLGFFPAATPLATVTTGGLNQVRVSGVVCASTPVLRWGRQQPRRWPRLTGQLEEVGAGYTFFWSGQPKAERRDAGVAFAVRNDIRGRLPCLPQGSNDRLMSLRLPLRVDKFATIISAYAPPRTSSDAAKDKFYEDLHSLLATVRMAD